MKINNYVGHKIGMFTVLEKTNKRNKQKRLLHKCKCECGNYSSSGLKQSVSCGCWRKSRGNRRAYVKLQYKNKSFIKFDTFENAVQTRLKAEEIYYKTIIEKKYLKER